VKFGALSVDETEKEKERRLRGENREGDRIFLEQQLENF
jgi:hypothetical protein